MQKETPDFEKREKKNEEIISRNCLPHHERASTFINTHKAARLHLLPMLSRYCVSPQKRLPSSGYFHNGVLLIVAKAYVYWQNSSIFRENVGIRVFVASQH
jgi:hypothetical protein